MADPYEADPSLPGTPSFGVPPAPGNFSETVPNKVAAKPGEQADPFTPLTPGEEREERVRLNFQAAHSHTLLGSALAAGAADSAKGLTPEERARFKGDVEQGVIASGAELPVDLSGANDVNFDAIQDNAKDRLIKMQADQLAYANMPAWKGLVEGAYSLAGQFAGGMASPEGLVFPEIKWGNAGWQAAHPLLSSVIGYGFGQAAIQGAANPVIQDNQIKAGLRKEFDPVEAMLAYPTGFAFGGGLTLLHQGGAALFRYGSRALERYMVDGVIRGPQLTPEVKPHIAAEPLRAPADTFEFGAAQEVPGTPANRGLSVGEMPEGAEGTVRLWRRAEEGDDITKAQLFTTHEFPGATHFIDVPEAFAAAEVKGDRVPLPAEFARTAQEIPATVATKPSGEPVAPREEPAAAEPSVFDNLTDFDKATHKGEAPQTFTQWVRSQGGLEPNPELRAIYGRTKGDLIRTRAKGGKSLDEIREAAVEQGWIPDEGIAAGRESTSTIEDVLKRLADEDKGVTHYHPSEQTRAQAAEARRDPKLVQTMDEMDVHLKDQGQHPGQLKGADKKVAKDIRNRAIEIAYTEDVTPEAAFDRAMREYDQHAAAIAGQKFKGAAHDPADTIPFFDEGAHAGAAPGEGGAIGGLGPGGERIAGAAAPEGGGGVAPSATEVGIAKRLKGMAGQGIGRTPGQTRPGEGVASANFHGPLTPVENLRQMMRRISQKLDLIVRKGVHERGALGTYNYDTEIVRIKEDGPDAVTTWSHEVGHAVEDRVPEITTLIENNEASMRAFAGVMGEGLEGETLRSEGFAEFMAGYITNRARLEQIDPKFTKAFRETMARENPELLATLDDAHASFEAYRSQPSDQAVDSMIVTHGEVPAPIDGDPLQRGPLARWFSNFYWNYVNKQHPLQVAFRYLATEYEKKNGKLLDLRPDQDPRLLAQVLGDAGFQKTVMDLTYGIQNMRDMTPEGASMFNILRKVTSDPLTGKEVSTAAEYLARRKSFDGYLVARWHIELRRQMSNGEIELTRMPTGMTDGDAALKVAQVEKTHPEWSGYAEELYAVQKLIAKLEHENGLRTTESYTDIMHERNRRYVPLYRDMSGISEALGVGGPGFRGDKPLEELGYFRRTGSGRNILSPTESIMVRLADINDAAHQNMVVRALRDLVNLVGGKEGARIAEMIPNNQLRALDMNVEDAVYRAAISKGWMPEDAKSLVRNLQHELGPDIRTKLYRQEAIKAGSRPIIFGWENGERFAMRLPDGLFGRQLVEVMDSLGPKGMATWAQAGGVMMDALTFTSQTLRTGATGTPTFMAKNLLRDAFMQFLLVPEAGVDTLAMANAIRGGRSYLLGDDFYRMYLSTGGIRGGVGASGLSRSTQQVEFERQIKRYATSPAAGQQGGWLPAVEKSKFNPSTLQQARSDMAKTLGAAGVEPHKMIWVGNIKEFMSRMEISESAGRVGLFRAVYEANIEMGRDARYAMFDAAQKARDFIDYGRMGSRMEMWSRLVPFLNANIQGVDKFMRTYPGMFTRALTVQEQAHKQALQQSLIPRVAAIAAVSAGITYAWQDDPVYQRLSVQQRSQNWIFRVPFLKGGVYDMLGGGSVTLPDGMQGAWIFIPKPWEPGTIFNLAEKAVEFLHSGDPEEAVKFVKSMRYTFSIPNPFELPAFRTAAGLASNYDDFFQRPIVSQSLQGVAPHLQANEYTNKFYVALARGMNMIWNSEDAHTWFRKNIPVVGAMLAAAWSPMEAQYLMQGMFGDWPRELGGIGGIGRSLINAAGGQGANFQLSDVPALRAFVKDRMAMGEPMNELYNQIGQNGGRLTVANKSMSKMIKDGDTVGATTYFNTLDDAQRDYVRIHQTPGGPLANVLHPLDRASALASVTRALKNGLLAEGGLATVRDPSIRIKLEKGKVDTLIQALNEYTAIEARNSNIVQGLGGYKNLPIVDTRPYLDVINKISPEVGRELSAQLARSKVMPIDSIQRYWPQAQRILRAGESVNPNQLANQLKTISNQAAAYGGYEGGGRKSGRGAVDAGGVTVKKGKAAPLPLPAEAGR